MWTVAGDERPRAYMTGTKDTELKIRRYSENHLGSVDIDRQTNTKDNSEKRGAMILSFQRKEIASISDDHCSILRRR